MLFGSIIFEIVLSALGFFDQFDPYPSIPVCFTRTSSGTYMKPVFAISLLPVSIIPVVLYELSYKSLRAQYNREKLSADSRNNLLEMKKRLNDKVRFLFKILFHNK